MKKVAFFTDILIEEFDGASRTMFQLINRIDKNQFDFFFIYGKGPNQFRQHKSFKVPTLNLPINKDYCIALPHFIKHKLENCLDRYLPDVIHIASPSLLGDFAISYAKRKNIPVISIYHTHFISYAKYYLQSFKPLIKPTEDWIKNKMKIFYNNCDIVYVPTKSIISELVSIGIDDYKLKLWQRGIDQQLFNPNKKEKCFLANITNNNNPTILFASRLVWEKNLKTLFEIYEVLQNEKIALNFIVIGDGKAKEQAQYSMPKAIFLGKKNHNELAKYYASADVFVFPSTTETYGNVITEAMASGLPCVIANEGGSASLIRHEETGFKCHPYHAKEYAHYILKLLHNQTLHQEISYKAQAEIKQFCWDNLSQRYFTEIDHLTKDDSIVTGSLLWAN